MEKFLKKYSYIRVNFKIITLTKLEVAYILQREIYSLLINHHILIILPYRKEELHILKMLNKFK